MGGLDILWIRWTALMGSRELGGRAGAGHRQRAPKIDGAHQCFNGARRNIAGSSAHCANSVKRIVVDVQLTAWEKVCSWRKEGGPRLHCLCSHLAMMILFSLENLLPSKGGFSKHVCRGQGVGGKTSAPVNISIMDSNGVPRANGH